MATTLVFCLENPMDRGVWQATVYGVSKSLTQLKRLRMHAHTYIYISDYIIELYIIIIFIYN